MDWKNWEPWVATAFGAVGVFAGKLPIALLALLGLICLDMISGWARAIAKEGLSSTIFRKGLNKKFQTLLIVVATMVIESVAPEIIPPLANVNVGISWPLSNFVAGLYAGVEFLSILENGSQSGTLVPKIVRDALKQVRDEQMDTSDSP